MSGFTNHHQIYTHCVSTGVVKGQYWQGTEGNEHIWGVVEAITEDGIVIMSHAPKLMGNTRIRMSDLITKAKIREPVVLKTFTQPNGSIHTQIFVESNRPGKYLAVGEIRRGYIFMCDCSCHNPDEEVLHVFPCCDRCYEKRKRKYVKKESA